jgi:uridine kinase
VDLIARLAAAVADLNRRLDRVLVGIDGPDAAGKSTMADRLARALPAAVRASADDFQHPPEVRYRRGDLSPDGCYRDTFDYSALREGCLMPFRDGAVGIAVGCGAVREVPARAVPGRAVLVVDGVFLLRPELRDLWTLTVHLTISPAETVRRARVRDLDRFGSLAEIDRRYAQRYLPAQALYVAEADPARRADVVVDNERVEEPVVRRWSAGGAVRRSAG